MIKVHISDKKYLIVTNTEAYVVSYNRGLNGARIEGSKDKDGYIRIKIARKQVGLHRIIARMFLGERPEGYCVNHIDSNKTNNHPSNLEYLTIGENVKHAIASGNHPCCKPETNGRYIDGRTLNKKSYRKMTYQKEKAKKVSNEH